MHKDITMAIIANDLDSMGLRIEALEAHPELTAAGEFVRKAHTALVKARVDIHQRDMKERFAKMDEGR